MKTSSPSARRPSAGVMPGRWGACLAVRTSPAAFCQYLTSAFTLCSNWRMDLAAQFQPL